MPESAGTAVQFTRIAAGFVHTCGLDEAGTAFCWGSNDYSQLGALPASTCGGRPCSTQPVAVEGRRSFIDIAAGWVHSCGVGADGRVWCWGGGAHEGRGFLGDGTLSRRVDPVLVVADSLFASVALGDGHSCALTHSGVAYCWGDNAWGQLGDGSRVDRGTPVRVAGGAQFRSLAAGAYHTCGVTRDDIALCWGDNRWGQLGTGEVAYNSLSSAQLIPTPVAGDGGYREIVAGWEHSCGIATTGGTRCWGRNELARQLGDASEATHRGTPAPVADDRGFVALTAGALATCGRTAGGETFCWGGNYYGMLGDGSASNGIDRPVRTMGGPFSDIAIGQSHACGLSSDRRLWCWGDRSAGQF